MPLFNQSIRRKIVGIALGLVVLMLVTSILSMVMSSKAGVLLDELTNRYIPAYGIDRPEVAIDGQRRVMAIIMFSDMSAFTAMSEGMTPRGLVKVMNHYFTGMSGRFDDARTAFNAALERAPGDGPSRTMLARIAQFETTAPAADWGGAWRLDSK